MAGPEPERPTGHQPRHGTPPQAALESLYFKEPLLKVYSAKLAPIEYIPASTGRRVLRARIRRKHPATAG
jgi:hypothetical protein